MGNPLVLDPDSAGRCVVGLDLSLTATGIAVIDVSTGELFTAVHTSPAPAADRIDCHVLRHRSLVDGIAAQVIAADPVLAVVEGLSFSVSAKDSSLTRRGFLWWALAERLCEAGVPLLEAAPTQIKKIGTGKGNASKAEMVAAYVSAWPSATVDRHVHDRADAAFSAGLGAAWLGGVPLPFTMTVERRKVLKKLTEPTTRPRLGASTVSAA